MSDHPGDKELQLQMNRAALLKWAGEKDLEASVLRFEAACIRADPQSMEKREEEAIEHLRRRLDAIASLHAMSKQLKGDGS